jgi:hypothetical protein
MVSSWVENEQHKGDRKGSQTGQEQRKKTNMRASTFCIGWL